jgi:hypothetical protein
MKRNDKPNPALLAEVNAAIGKANILSSGEFDGLRGSLPDGTAIVLADIVAYLRQYLLDERGLTVEQVHRISSGRSVSRLAEDEGVRVALGMMNSIASALRLSDKQAIRLLLSGKDGVRGAKVREGGGRRGADIHEERRRRSADMQTRLDEAARRYPAWSYRELAEHVASALDCDERTVRRNTRNPRIKGDRDTTS